MQIENFRLGPMDNNLYLVLDDTAKEFVAIDPTLSSEPALERAKELVSQGYRCVAIWNTHGHFDHVYGNALWKETLKVPLYAHPADGFFLDHLREQAIWFGFEAPEVVRPDFPIDPENSDLKVGEYQPSVLYLPGHSPGSVGFYFEAQATCIVGDVLFAGSVGRTDLPGCSAADLADSLRELWKLPADTKILPGHGEATVLGHEIARNAVARQLMTEFP